MNALEITDFLRGFTFLRKLEFAVEPDNGFCSLSIELAESETAAAKVICAEFSFVSSLDLKDLGGGATQFLLMSVEDVKDWQLDRVRYEIRELERETIHFFCQNVTLSGPTLVT